MWEPLSNIVIIWFVLISRPAASCFATFQTEGVFWNWRFNWVLKYPFQFNGLSNSQHCRNKTLMQNFRPASSLCTVVVIISATAATLLEILGTIPGSLEVNRPLRQLLLSDHLVTRGVKGNDLFLNNQRSIGLHPHVQDATTRADLVD